MFALFDGEDPTYKQIDGSWLNDEPYVTIHRLAGDGQTHGLFQCAANYAKTVSRNVRLDTHADNLIMQSLIQKYDFTPCGTIRVADGSPRLAYHLSLQ